MIKKKKEIDKLKNMER